MSLIKTRHSGCVHHRHACRKAAGHGWVAFTFFVTKPDPAHTIVFSLSLVSQAKKGVEGALFIYRRYVRLATNAPQPSPNDHGILTNRLRHIAF